MPTPPTPDRRGDRPARLHFPGLDSLRFLAALFVVIGHIPLNQQSVGLPHPSWGTFFYRGAPAVCFFFTLSGFLITYLLLEERRQTGGIDVKGFYFRRMCRIWPLYFGVILFGLAFYNALLPALDVSYRVDYKLGLALLLYVLFLPNLMNSLYTVGGILNPTWSIGIEEQFYLLWAPAVKGLRGHLPRLCWVVLAVSLALFWINLQDWVFSGWSARMVDQLKFHFMAAGALCAGWLHTRREGFLALPLFASRALQLVLLALLLDYYLLSLIPWDRMGEELIQLLLYPWLIVTVAANPRNVVRVENPAFDYLGKISYGIYMLHMVAVYATSALFKARPGWQGNLVLFTLGYYTLALGTTFLLAHLSYRILELPFLRLKNRRRGLATAPVPGPVAVSGPI